MVVEDVAEAAERFGRLRGCACDDPLYPCEVGPAVEAGEDGVGTGSVAGGEVICADDGAAVVEIFLAVVAAGGWLHHRSAAGRSILRMIWWESWGKICV